MPQKSFTVTLLLLRAKLLSIPKQTIFIMSIFGFSQLECCQSLPQQLNESIYFRRFQMMSSCYHPLMYFRCLWKPVLRPTPPIFWGKLNKTLLFCVLWGEKVNIVTGIPELTQATRSGAIFIKLVDFTPHHRLLCTFKYF